MRYLGVLLYDADRVEEMASTENEQDLYEKQLELFLDPFDEAIIAQAEKMVLIMNGLKRHNSHRFIN